MSDMQNKLAKPHSSCYTRQIQCMVGKLCLIHRIVLIWHPQTFIYLGPCGWHTGNNHSPVIMTGNRQLVHAEECSQKASLRWAYMPLFKGAIQWLRIKNYVVHSTSFQTFLYGHLKLTLILENSVCYCYISYEMTHQFLSFQVQMNSYNRN